MEFTKRLREGVRRGDITCSVRIWMRAHVKRGGRYPMGEGQIEVDAIDRIEFSDITDALARESGFNGLVDLLKVAKHGPGTNIYLVRFHYIAPASHGAASKARSRAAAAPRSKKRASARQRTRIMKIVKSLPEGVATAQGPHLSLEVRNKRFGWFLDDHHGDGRVALNCKGSADMHDVLRQMAPEQFHVPKYLGNKGWIGLWLDVSGTDSAAVELAVREAYRLVAPKVLARELP
jgi:predicted DNA-binding protein (MmcQ/YjbR family)